MAENVELAWGLPHNIKQNRIGRLFEEAEAGTLPYGAKRIYHSITKDWITNEIFRRVEPDGRTMGEYWREEIETKLDLDVMIGFDEEGLERVFDVS